MTSATASSGTRRSRAIGHRGLSLEGLGEHAVSPLDALQEFLFAVGEADRPPAVDEGSGDGLLYPPGRVGREAHVAGAIVFFRRLDEAHIPFLDQIEQRHVGRHEAAGDLHDQAQVRLESIAASLLRRR